MASSRQAVVHVVQLQFIVRLLWLGMKPQKTSKYGVAIFWLNPLDAKGNYRVTANNTVIGTLAVDGWAITLGNRHVPKLNGTVSSWL